MANIVGATFEQGNRHRRLQHIAHRGQVSFKQLILQSLCPCRDNHFTAPHQCGRKVSESFARACARFEHGTADIIERLRDSTGHLGLLIAGAVVRQLASECALCSEDLLELVGLGEREGLRGFSGHSALLCFGCILG